MYMLKKLFLLFFTISLLSSCTFRNNQDISNKVVILDSCEYIEYYITDYSTGIEHKGNCKNCIRRDSIAREKLKKEILNQIKYAK